MIRLNVTVEDTDPEVESLLEYLNENCTRVDPLTRNPIPNQIWLLERALKWLKPQTGLLFINPHSRNHSATASLTLTPSQTSPESHPTASVAPEVATPS